jgi:hypothetical protein
MDTGTYIERMARMTCREYINSMKRYVKPSIQKTFIEDARIDENFPDIYSASVLDR